MRYTTILFDADRTLFDFDLAEEHALEAAMLSHGYPYSKSIREQYSQINERLWRSLECGQITKKSLVSQRFRLFFEQLGIAQDGEAFNQEYLEQLKNEVCLIKGAYSVCKTLSQYSRLYILTNGISYVQKNRLKHSKLCPYIEEIFVSEEIGSEKPSPSCFMYVAEHVKTWDASGTLMVGDSLASDIQGALSFGIDSCWFNPRHLSNSSALIPTYEIHSLTELLPIVITK